VSKFEKSSTAEAKEQFAEISFSPIRMQNEFGTNLGKKEKKKKKEKK
jgi:hypothetical protein